jgi:tripartite-type tricarboxylate transporter receptor subunit TctC
VKLWSRMHMWLMVAPFLVSGQAFAQTYPSQPIRLIVGYTAGATDISARMMAVHLAQNMGQPVLVENRPGAGSLIGAEAVVNSAPDGYTLFYGTTAISTFKVLVKGLRFDPATDLAPITQFAKGGFVIAVPPSLPVKTLKEFIAYAKQRPGKLNYGSLGKNSVMLIGEAFKQLAGVDMTEVPFKGLAPARLALVTNEIQFLTDSFDGAMPLIKDGRMRPLSTTYDQRAAILPDVPSAPEAGLPGFQGHWWIGIFAPGKTPAPIISKLHDEFVKAARTPDVIKQLTDVQVGSMILNTPDEFKRAIADEMRFWSKVAQDGHITPE